MSRRSLRGYRISNWAILFVFVLGVGPVGFFLWHRRAVLRAEQWPRVEATVVERQIASSASLIEGRLGNRIVQRDEVAFGFSYAVDGRGYVSRRFYLFGSAPAAIVGNQYPPGRKFEARYDLVHPEVAVVMPGPLRYRFIVVSVVCLILMVMALVYNPRQD